MKNIAKVLEDIKQNNPKLLSDLSNKYELN